MTTAPLSKAYLALILISTGILTACGGSGGSGSMVGEEVDGQPIDLSAFDCSALSLAASSSIPLRELELLNLPPELIVNNVGGGAFLVTANGQARDVVLTWYPEQDRSFVSVPFFEQSAQQGQEVTLHIVDSDGQLLCPLKTFTIEALPPGNSELEDVRATLGTLIESRRIELGLSREALKPASTTRLNEESYALALLQYAFDDPDNPNNLTRIADGSAALYDDPTLDRALLNQLIAATRLRDWLEGYATLVESPSAASLNVAKNDGGSLRGEAAGLRKDIPDYQTLERLMLRQQAAEGWVGSGTATAQVFNDVALANSLAGLITGPYGLAIGAAMYVGKLALEAEARLLPSRITDLDVSYINPIAVEDDDGEYSLSSPLATATSDAWDVSYTAVDGVLLLVGSARGATQVVQEGRAVGGAVSRLRPGGVAPAELGFGIGDTIATTPGIADGIATGADVASNLGSRVDSAACPDGEPNCPGLVAGRIVIEPFTWTGIAIPADSLPADAISVTAAPNAIPVVEFVDLDRRAYRAISAGSSGFRFILDIGVKSFRIRKPITVQAIEVTWGLPTSISINEGEELCVTDARIKNAIDSSGRFTVSGPQVNEAVDAGQYCFKAPDKIIEEFTDPVLCSLDAVLFPELYTLEFESLTRTGPRDPTINPAWEKRSIFAIISVQPLAENHADAVPPERPECEEEQPTPTPTPQPTPTAGPNPFAGLEVTEGPVPDGLWRITDTAISGCRAENQEEPTELTVIQGLLRFRTQGDSLLVWDDSSSSRYVRFGDVFRLVSSQFPALADSLPPRIDPATSPQQITIDGPERFFFSVTTPQCSRDRIYELINALDVDDRLQGPPANLDEFP